MNNQTQLSPLLTAIQADDDEQTERVVLHLTATAEPDLLALLQTGTPDQRWWAVRALAQCGTVQALPLLAATLADGDVALRTVTAMALGALAQRLPTALMPYLPQLAERLADLDGAVRQATADALAQCGAAAVPTLSDVLRFSEHQGARSRAAAALRKIGTPATVPVLFHCLNDANYLVHIYAYEALDEMGLLETQLVL
ncbi:MAG: HEAT repeat domain-containing protein [Caldilineaceae bacterium]|nr:HEAT repeat domain-containing protein [Caldilineaceae bacterium]